MKQHKDVTSFIFVTVNPKISLDSKRNFVAIYLYLQYFKM